MQMGEREVRIPLPLGSLGATLNLPAADMPLVVFAHGSGSSRLSPRNRFVAAQLVSAGFGTLLLDLLTEIEDRNTESRFDIQLLAQRLVDAVRWAGAELQHDGPIAFFGASTGAAAALVAARELGGKIAALVSRGGRPDLAGDALESIACPTLLLVGERDEVVVELNRQALARMPAETVKELSIVPGATHLFEEPGTL